MNRIKHTHLWIHCWFIPDAAEGRLKTWKNIYPVTQQDMRRLSRGAILSLEKVKWIISMCKMEQYETISDIMN